MQFYHKTINLADTVDDSSDWSDSLKILSGILVSPLDNLFLYILVFANQIF